MYEKNFQSKGPELLEQYVITGLHIIVDYFDEIQDEKGNIQKEHVSPKKFVNDAIESMKIF